MGNAFGIIALISGILSLCCGWLIPFPYGFILPFVAIVFGIIGIIKDDSKGMGIAGLVLGIISLFCVTLLAPLMLLLIAMIGLGALMP